ncbi:MAG: YbhB/YbcL family Raf kinase inhibitor-like protein [Candidatus Melainabacteria bacterium]
MRQRRNRYGLGLLLLTIACSMAFALQAAEHAEPYGQGPAGTPMNVNEELPTPHIIGKLLVSSPAFANGKTIPAQYTCKGDDISPPLAIHQIPKGTRSVALIVDDPDAPMGTWTHWVVWNLFPGQNETITLAPNSLPPESVQGINSFRRKAYGGPCPPGGTHRYFFKAYALDVEMPADAVYKSHSLLEDIQPHIIAQGELMGTFKK